MIECAIAAYPYMKVCTYQIDQGGLSYVGKDFEKFNKLYPNTDFYFIVGADNAYTIDKWDYFDLHIQNCTIAVAGREVAGQEKTLDEQIAYMNSTCNCYRQHNFFPGKQFRYHAGATGCRLMM
ncbi:MAG: hypothetical protein IJU77_06055 [Butyrivibrio sp.]|nr:hypothetical protein [Butyrivibrio sp.]